MRNGLRRLASASTTDFWLVDLDADAGPDALAVLSEAERERAARFVLERDRQRWANARRGLREVLALRTGGGAAALRFDEGAFGKPCLADHPQCAFSLGHSGAFALVGVEREDAPGAAIGVDLEVVAPMGGLDELAARVFTPQERRGLETAGPDARLLRFLAGWTRKEACLKALGVGLQVEPASFAVGLVADESGRTVAIDTPDGTRTVVVASLALPGALVGAFARTLPGLAPGTPKP